MSKLQTLAADTLEACSAPVVSSRALPQLGSLSWIVTYITQLAQTYFPFPQVLLIVVPTMPAKMCFESSDTLQILVLALYVSLVEELEGSMRGRNAAAWLET